MKTYRIACIPGDGIGKEVIPAGQEVLQALAAAGADFRFEFTSFDWGGDYYRKHGKMMPDDGREALRGMDAILFGAAGDPHIPDHVTLWGLRLKICQGFEHETYEGDALEMDALVILMLCALGVAKPY